MKSTKNGYLSSDALLALVGPAEKDFEFAPGQKVRIRTLGLHEVIALGDDATSDPEQRIFYTLKLGLVEPVLGDDELHLLIQGRALAVRQLVDEINLFSAIQAETVLPLSEETAASA